jgi:phosphate transport system permease protein
MRALSANIATELPEAARGSSHYRVLFLSGLVLFSMTFLINSGAELIRKRFRARYAEQL